MRVQVDRARCQGHAMCQITAPEVFVLDEEGYARACGTVLPELAEAVRRSAAGCPEQAILVED